MHSRQPTPFSAPSSSVRSRRRLTPPVVSHQAPQRLERHKVLALEATAKVALNFVLAVTATTGLFRLIPYHLALQEKLSQIEVEVQTTQERVNRLQADFDRTFDPGQTPVLMQEESHRVDGKRRPIVWLEPSAQP